MGSDVDDFPRPEKLYLHWVQRAEGEERECLQTCLLPLSRGSECCSDLALVLLTDAGRMIFPAKERQEAERGERIRGKAFHPLFLLAENPVQANAAPCLKLEKGIGVQIHCITRFSAPSSYSTWTDRQTHKRALIGVVQRVQ